MHIVRNERLQTCPLVAAHVDSAALRAAIKILNGQFPEIDKLRDAIAHDSSTDSKPEKHAPDGVFGFSRISEHDQFEIAYQGKARHLDITPKRFGNS